MHCANHGSPFMFRFCTSFTRLLLSGSQTRGHICRSQFSVSSGEEAASPSASWQLVTVTHQIKSGCRWSQTSPRRRLSMQTGFARTTRSKREKMSTSSDVPQYVSPQDNETFYFGKFKIDPSEVFLVTDYSYAFVNLKPVVPDVLVSSRRVVNRFLDLTSEEVSDLWLTAKHIGQKLEPFYKASSLTFTIQDGPKAGQTVPHVHVHILPRKDGDFANNDEIYDAINKKETQLARNLNLDLQRKDRTFEEMANEAANLCALF